MGLELFLNDLSIPEEDCVLDAALERLRGLVRTLRAADALGPEVRLNADRPFAELHLAPNWPLAALRNQPECAEERVYLKTIVARAPWSSSLASRPPDAAGGADYALLDDAQVLQRSPPVALGLAHDLNGLALSVPSTEFWQRRHLPLSRLTLDEDAETITTRIEARNACTPADVEHHRDALCSASRPDVHDGAQLWHDRQTLFPRLRFIPRVRSQLEALQHGNPVLVQVVQRLHALNEAIEDWERTAAARPSFPFDVRPESSSKRRALVSFHDAEGITRVFSDHCDFGPIEGRIHFIVEAAPFRHALIGHADRKLGIG